MEKGALRSVIERTYSLNDVADAIRHVEAGGVAGKIAVTVGAGQPKKAPNAEREQAGRTHL